MPPPGQVALLRLHDRDGFYVGDASWLTFTIDEAAFAAQRFEQACASVFIG